MIDSLLKVAALIHQVSTNAFLGKTRKAFFILYNSNSPGGDSHRASHHEMVLTRDRIPRVGFYGRLPIGEESKFDL